MIPIADDIPSHSKPIVNYFLIGINIALFLWELKLEISGELSNLINSWGVIPAQISIIATDAFAGGNPAALIALVISASSLLKAMFLHSSFGQILGNFIFLWVFGQKVEDILGHGRYLVFYLVCGVSVAIIQVSLDPTLAVPLIGANGAIAAILGAYLINFPKAKIDSILPLVIIFIPVELPAIFYLFWWFIQQVFYGIGSLNISASVNSGSIGYWAHGVGLLIGAVLGRLMARRQPVTFGIDKLP